MFIDICRGFGMKVIAYDMYPVEGIDYVDLDTLFRESDFISLHCPLTDETHHMVAEQRFAIMKDSAILINTSLSLIHICRRTRECGCRARRCRR